MAFKSKFLKKAWEDERFTYFGMEFAIDKAEQIIAAHPRPPQKAPKAFLEGFVGTVEQDKKEEEPTINPDGSKTWSMNLFTVGVNKEHVNEVDENKPGIIATIMFKPRKGETVAPPPTYILIDGNHRAKKRLRMGLDFMEAYEYSNDIVPPAKIEVFENGTWVPVQSLKTAEFKAKVFKAAFLGKVALPQKNLISLQEAQDRKLFGPVYHGTTGSGREKIDAEGFKVFEGEAGSEGIQNGYSAYDGFYYDRIPAPVHHLGFGVYFTTVKSIAKMFNGNSTGTPQWV